MFECGACEGSRIVSQKVVLGDRKRSVLFGPELQVGIRDTNIGAVEWVLDCCSGPLTIESIIRAERSGTPQ